MPAQDSVTPLFDLEGPARPDETASQALQGLAVSGLFAGIGGIELGLHDAGHSTVELCEADPTAIDVLADRFPGQTIHPDVATMDRVAEQADVVTAGFPCQDLSQAGRTAGIAGGRSGLVDHVFRLLERRRATGTPPRWLLLENVPFMLQLDGGHAMHRLTNRLEELGYRWAYRIVDTRAFGIPQRRRRVLMLASPSEDPRGSLLAQDIGAPPPVEAEGRACGFYWTEGLRGLGLAVDAIPTLKGGSTVGIPSPPAIWVPGEGAFTTDLRDAERLQGFPTNWTIAADTEGRRSGTRWKLVGNAVSVPVASWLGRRLRHTRQYVAAGDTELTSDDRWPDAAWGDGSGRWKVHVSAWPERHDGPPLLDFLDYPLKPLSARATAGFLRRADASTLRFPEGFKSDLREHLRRVTGRST